MSREGYTRYRLLKDNPTFSFSGYRDENGDIAFIEDGKDEKGNVRMKKFLFREGFLEISNTKKKEIEHLDNSPFMKGSELGRRQDPMYTKIDPEGDAKKDFVAKKLAAEAMARALEVCDSDDMVRMVATLCGAASASDDVRRSAIMNYATNHPEKFLDLTSDDNKSRLKYESFIRDCASRGTISQRGQIYYFHSETVGTSLDDAIKTLMDDPDLLTAIRLAHDEMVNGPTKPPKKAVVGGNKN